MLEEKLVEKICAWLRKQGFEPKTNVTVGKRRRKIEVDIYFERGENRPVAIEVKSRKEGFFDGLGKALVYVAYTNCEVWLALPEKLFNLALHLKPLGLPFDLFNATKMKLYKMVGFEPKKATFYLCPLCGKNISNINTKKFLDLHLRRAHGCDKEELIEALRFYRVMQTDERLRAQAKYLETHSEELDYAEGGEQSDWIEEERGWKN